MGKRNRKILEMLDVADSQVIDKHILSKVPESIRDASRLEAFCCWIEVE